MRNYNMTVKEFVDHYIPLNFKKIRIIKSMSIQFEGSLEELNSMLHRRKDLMLYTEVDLVTASEDGYLCISCK